MLHNASVTLLLLIQPLLLSQRSLLQNIFRQMNKKKSVRGWRAGMCGLGVTGSHILHLPWSWFLAVGEVSAFMSPQALLVTATQGALDHLLHLLGALSGSPVLFHAGCGAVSLQHLVPWNATRRSKDIQCSSELHRSWGSLCCAKQRRVFCLLMLSITWRCACVCSSQHASCPRGTEGSWGQRWQRAVSWISARGYTRNICSP